MRSVRSIINVRRDEVPFVLAMFGYFLLVITSFWILKPIKKALFISYYDAAGITFLPIHRTAAQGELIAKVLNMVVAIVATIVFTQLARRWRRQQLTYVFTAFTLVCYGLYYFLVQAPGDITVWTFYLFGDLFNTLMVATFFAFLNDSVSAEASKRVYGPVVFGGVLGGVIGSTFVAAWVERVATSTWVGVCAVLALGIWGAAALAGRTVGPMQPAEPAQAAPAPARPATSTMDAARLVWRSPYLLSIVAVVGLYEIASTLLDFMFTSTVAYYLNGPAIGAHLARVFTITNWVSMLVQIFVTSFVMTRFGVGTALLVLPLAMLCASTSYLLFPTLWIGSLLNTADNGFSYSVNQSAKEALYVPTTRDEKYQAKAVIDMFVQRFAKTVAVFLSLLVTTLFTNFGAIRWLSLAVIALAAVWLPVVRYAGREFERRTKAAPRSA